MKELIPVTVNGEKRWLNPDLCQRLRYGFIALYNGGGTLEEMQVIVNQCYPDDITKVNADIIFLFTDKQDDRCWTSSYSTPLTYYPISAFFAEPVEEKEAVDREFRVEEKENVKRLVAAILNSAPEHYTTRDLKRMEEGAGLAYTAALSTLPAPAEQVVQYRDCLNRLFDTINNEAIQAYGSLAWHEAAALLKKGVPEKSAEQGTEQMRRDIYNQAIDDSCKEITRNSQTGKHYYYMSEYVWPAPKLLDEPQRQYLLKEIKSLKK